MRAARQPIRFVGLYAYHESALAARAHRHVAVDEEGETAEHALLGQPALAHEKAPHTVRKVFVERHTRSVGRAVRADTDEFGTLRRSYREGFPERTTDPAATA